MVTSLSKEILPILKDTGKKKKPSPQLVEESFKIQQRERQVGVISKPLR